MSDNPTKYEVLIEQYLRSILDISAGSYTKGSDFPSKSLFLNQVFSYLWVIIFEKPPVFFPKK